MESIEEQTSPSYLTILSRTFYAIQKQRIEAGNRIAMNVRDARLTEDEASLLNAHLKTELKAVEDSIAKDVASALKSVPIYRQWFSKIKGIGPIIAGGMIGEIADISRFEHMSNLWSWAGYGIHNGTADRLIKHQKANWNPSMKVLGWKAGKSFVKVGGYFRQQYDQFKREEIAKNTGWVVELNPKDMIGYKVWTEDGSGDNITKDNAKAIIKDVEDDHIYIVRTDGHVDSRAIRRNVKLFLGLTWMKWREIEGLVVHAPYAGAMMGHEIITPDEMLFAEDRLRQIDANTRKAKAKPSIS